MLMEKQYFMKLNDIDCYRDSFHLSNKVWDIVINWNYFARDTIGKQYVRAIDSISANIAEGFGRYGKKDKVKFYRYSQGSLNESLDWNQKSKVRNLVSKEEYEYIFAELQKLPRAINALVLFTNQKLKI